MDHVLQRWRGLGDRHSPLQRPTGTIPTGCVPSRGSRRTGDRSSRVTPEGEADEAGHAWSVFTGRGPSRAAGWCSFQDRAWHPWHREQACGPPGLATEPGGWDMPAHRAQPIDLLDVHGKRAQLCAPPELCRGTLSPGTWPGLCPSSRPIPAPPRAEKACAPRARSPGRAGFLFRWCRLSVFSGHLHGAKGPTSLFLTLSRPGKSWSSARLS